MFLARDEPADAIVRRFVDRGAVRWWCGRRLRIAVAAPVVPAPAQAPAQAPVIEAPAPPKLDKRKEDAERSTAIAASLAAMCDDMEKLAEAKDGRAIDRLLQQAAKSFEQLGKVIGAERETLGDRYSAARYLPWG